MISKKTLRENSSAKTAVLEIISGGLNRQTILTGHHPAFCLSLQSTTRARRMNGRGDSSIERGALSVGPLSTALLDSCAEKIDFAALALGQLIAYVEKRVF